MKNRMKNGLQYLFGLAMLYAVMIGVVVAVLFGLGFILGGAAGELLAIWGGRLMKTALPVAATGVLCGLISIYVEGIHELTIKKR